MATHRRSIKLFPHERPLLVDLYLRRRIPIDQYEVRQQDLNDFTKDWNGLSGRNDAPADILHYLRTQRKRGLWVRFDGNHEVTPPVTEMTAEESEILVAIYQDNVADFAHGSDVIAYDPEIAELLAKEFAAEIGRIIPAPQLIAKLTALRKRGLLPKAAEFPKRDDDEIGFGDIDQVAG
jgi:hypothetical protein